MVGFLLSFENAIIVNRTFMDDSKTEYELIDRLYYSEEKISISISQIFKDFDKSSLHIQKKKYFTNSHNSSSNISQLNSKNKKKKEFIQAHSANLNVE